MNDSFLPAEVESLIQGYVEGELSATECTRLGHLLQASPALITPILANLRMDALIRQTVLQTAGLDLDILPHQRRGLPESVVLPKLKGFPRLTRGLAVAACLVVLVALGAMVLGPDRALRLITGAKHPSGTGSILYEHWKGIPGDAVTDLTSHPNFRRAPTGSELLRQFEAPSNRGQYYGARIRGYLHPPVTGTYLFWIASDDASELWLSEDDDPTRKRRICFLRSWAPSREWTFSPSQQSQPIRLEAGHRYYIEALHKQGSAGDGLAVAWQSPGTAREILPGRALSPVSEANVAAP
jgi:PA14 domain-containing protein